MRIVMAGASGFLGRNLRERLVAEGHETVQLVRREPRRPDEARWDPHRGNLDPDVLAGAGVVVNLAGAGLANRRWTDHQRAVLVDSRVKPTATLAAALAALPADRRPGILLNASAVGYYGDTGDAAVDESAPAGTDYLGRMCQAWEGATGPAGDVGVRVVLLRSGLILHRSGGLLRPQLIPFYFGLGGPMGGGRHWMPWISLADWLSAVVFLLDRGDIGGPVNVTGPEPVRNVDFVNAFGRAVRRPTVIPLPSFALRILLGPFADEGVVVNQRVLPGVLSRAGFTFAHPDIDSAFQAAMHTDMDHRRQTER